MNRMLEMEQKPLTGIERKFLEILADYDGPVHTGWLGAEVWSGTSAVARHPQHYARAAGKVLNRLRRRGYARYEIASGSWGWVATGSGKTVAWTKTLPWAKTMPPTTDDDPSP